ncbi:putative ABC transporter permease [Caloramator sp.]|jgi:uncharacterized membrane protein|uniref:putative ABC transporter permease n=1 Tax=Caloramator sp. TaxID=1871330 RepID=UPI0025BE078C|nr:putative ABC transporter permease [Caloramator sp.]
MIEYLIDVIIYFTFYSFIGWCLETVFASVNKRKFINRGFLYGPFCPIYGFGALLIIFSEELLRNVVKPESLSVTLKILVAILLTTTLEYITGFILEKIFNRKWWDYSNNFLNLHGRICLTYSILWGILAYILINVIHPFSEKYIGSASITLKLSFAVIIIIYFIIDTIKSVTEILDLKEILKIYYKNPLESFWDKNIKNRRIIKAFPGLDQLNISKINKKEVMNFTHGKFKKRQK